jgi:hypothetical protein
MGYNQESNYMLKLCQSNDVVRSVSPFNCIICHEDKFTPIKGGTRGIENYIFSLSKILNPPEIIKHPFSKCKISTKAP